MSASQPNHSAIIQQYGYVYFGQGDEKTGEVIFDFLPFYWGNGICANSLSRPLSSEFQSITPGTRRRIAMKCCSGSWWGEVLKAILNFEWWILNGTKKAINRRFTQPKVGASKQFTPRKAVTASLTTIPRMLPFTKLLPEEASCRQSVCFMGF